MLCCAAVLDREAIDDHDFDRTELDGAECWGKLYALLSDLQCCVAKARAGKSKSKSSFFNGCTIVADASGVRSDDGVRARPRTLLPFCAIRFLRLTFVPMAKQGKKTLRNGI